MSRPYFSVKHVETMTRLPEILTPGRLYFVDDEQVIVIDHGDGLPPVIYGGKPGPQGATGEPQASLKREIDVLAQTELEMQALIWDEGKKFRDALSRITNQFTETFEHLHNMADKNAQTIMGLSDTIKRSFENYDSAISVLGKAVSNLYPDYPHPITDETDSPDTPSTPTLLNTVAQNVSAGDTVSLNGAKHTVRSYNIGTDGAITMTLESQGEFSDNTDPLDNESVNVGNNSYTIQQTNYTDGSTLLDLTKQKSVVETLNDGDTVSVNGQDMNVSNFTRNTDGSISLELS